MGEANTNNQRLQYEPSNVPIIFDSVLKKMKNIKNERSATVFMFFRLKLEGICIIFSWREVSIPVIRSNFAIFFALHSCAFSLSCMIVLLNE